MTISAFHNVHLSTTRGQSYRKLHVEHYFPLQTHMSEIECTGNMIDIGLESGIDMQSLNSHPDCLVHLNTIAIGESMNQFLLTFNYELNRRFFLVLNDNQS